MAHIEDPNAPITVRWFARKPICSRNRHIGVINTETGPRNLLCNIGYIVGS